MVSDIHRQVGDLTEFTPGNDTAYAAMADEIKRLRRENRSMSGMIRACAAHCTDERFQKEAQKFTDQWA